MKETTEKKTIRRKQRIDRQTMRRGEAVQDIDAGRMR
jgi:hypothetical protein